MKAEAKARAKYERLSDQMRSLQALSNASRMTKKARRRSNEPRRKSATHNGDERHEDQTWVAGSGVQAAREIRIQTDD